MYRNKNKIKEIKIIEVALLIGLCLGVASAMEYELTAGEPFSFNLSETYEYYSITGNITPISITQNGMNVTITTSKYMQSDEFSIIFFNKEKEVIHEYSSGGGGGTTRIYVENKTYVDVDKIIYKENDTEIQKLNDDLDKVDNDLKNEQALNNLMRIVLGVLFLTLLFIAYFLNKKKIKKNG